MKLCVWLIDWLVDWVITRGGAESNDSHRLQPSIQGGAQKRGHRPSYLIANIPKTPWPNCIEIGGLCNIICWTQSLTFCLKISSHCGATYRKHCYSSSVFGRWRHSAMKFLNKKVNDCVQHIILQKFTNFHTMSWSFQNICNEIGWPCFLRFLRHPVCNMSNAAYV